MFSINKTQLVEKEVQGSPRLRYPSVPLTTVFAFSFTSIWVDEAHEARTGKALWKAISAIFQLGLIKVLMTATPLLEQPNASYSSNFKDQKFTMLIWAGSHEFSSFNAPSKNDTGDGR